MTADLMKALISSMVLVVSFIAHGQSPITLKGRVTDIDSKESLPYASISIKDKPMGTVTNADGEFEFHLEAQHAEDTLVASMLEYASSYRKSLAEIKEYKNLRIRLRVKPVVLNEVVVTAKKIAPEQIVKKALKNIEKNYPTQLSMLSGFYRETHEENNRNVMLVEVAMDIYDPGYKKSLVEKVKLKNSRSSKNYRNSLFANTGVEKWNLAAGALNNNPVKHRDRHISTSKKFTLDSILYYNDRLIYVISFLSYIHRFPNFERKNTLHIDAQSFAILTYGWEEYAKEGKSIVSIPWRLSKESHLLLETKENINLIYEFGEYKGKNVSQVF